MVSAAPASYGLSAGSYAAPRQWLARRITRWTARCARQLARRRMLRDGPSGLPDCLLVHCFRGWFGWRWARCLARRLTGGASADGSTHARWRARQLAYIVSIRDGPGGLSNGSLVSLQRICPSADSLIRDGPGGPVRGDGSLDDCFTGKIR